MRCADGVLSMAQSADFLAQATTFLQSMFGENFPGRISFWTKKSVVKRTHWAGPDNLEGILRQVMQLDKMGHDSYFGCALRRKDLGQNQRGVLADCSAIGGVWV